MSFEHVPAASTVANATTCRAPTGFVAAPHGGVWSDASGGPEHAGSLNTSIRVSAHVAPPSSEHAPHGAHSKNACSVDPAGHEPIAVASKPYACPAGAVGSHTPLAQPPAAPVDEHAPPPLEADDPPPPVALDVAPLPPPPADADELADALALEPPVPPAACSPQPHSASAQP